MMRWRNLFFFKNLKMDRDSILILKFNFLKFILDRNSILISKFNLDRFSILIFRKIKDDDDKINRSLEFKTRYE